MNIKSKTYMKGEEFQKRQLWLDFNDAVGTALEVIAPAMNEARKWFADFVRKLKTKEPQKRGPYQYPLSYAVNYG